MILSVSKARALARAYLKQDETLDLSLTSLHYLGVYKRRQAFEVRFKYPEGLLVDPGLPIVLVVSAQEVQFVQSEQSFDIMDYCKARRA